MINIERWMDCFREGNENNQQGAFLPPTTQEVIIFRMTSTVRYLHPLPYFSCLHLPYSPHHPGMHRSPEHSPSSSEAPFWLFPLLCIGPSISALYSSSQTLHWQLSVPSLRSPRWVSWCWPVAQIWRMKGSNPQRPGIPWKHVTFRRWGAHVPSSDCFDVLYLAVVRTQPDWFQQVRRGVRREAAGRHS